MNPISWIKEMWLDGWRKGKEDAVSDQLKKNRLLSYWCKLSDEFLCSPKEFYAIVEKHLRERQIPGLELKYVPLRESNIFSKKRLYLQMRRERLVFEICAAPFGTGQFISSRFFDRRKTATWVDAVLAVGFVGLLGFFIMVALDRYIAIVVIGFVIATLWSFMRLAAMETIKWLDERLYVLPVIGPIYEFLFHPMTYYREDQNNMYGEAIHRAVTDSLNEFLSLKGMRPLTTDEQKPILGELWRK